MWDVLGGLVSGGASLIGGMINNGQQERLADKNNQWNFLMQLQNQAFQAGMSNTAFQRASNDMKAAGLNPAMMYGGSGGAASTPSGSMSSGTMPIVHDAIGPAVERAMAALKLGNETNLNAALVNKTVADTATSAASADEIRARTQNQNILNQTAAAESRARIKQLTGSAKQAEEAAISTTVARPGVAAGAKREQMKTEDYETVGPSDTLTTTKRVAQTAAKAAESAAKLTEEVNSAKIANDYFMQELRRSHSRRDGNPSFTPRFIPPSEAGFSQPLGSHN